MASLLELHRAGFSEDEIALWYNEKKLELDQAGFNRVKQSKYFDIPYEPKNSLINGLIGNKDFENTIKPDDKNLSPEKKSCILTQCGSSEKTITGRSLGNFDSASS